MNDRAKPANEDDEDVARVLGGDVDAFAGIVRRWQGPLVNLAFRFCGDAGRAEEMAQEAFLRAYRRLATYRGDAAFSTWLFALATNVYRDEVRRVPARMVALEDAAEPAAPASLRDDLCAREQDRIVHSAVLTLPAKYRDAVLLYYFQEMDLPAAARTLRVPEGTLKAHLSRGRQLLRAKLARLRPGQPATVESAEQGVVG